MDLFLFLSAQLKNRMGTCFLRATAFCGLEPKYGTMESLWKTVPSRPKGISLLMQAPGNKFNQALFLAILSLSQNDFQIRNYYMSMLWDI